MKHFFTGTMIALALILALVVSMAAFAENVEPETPELPALEETQPEQTPEQPQTEAPTEATDNTALQEAFDAYRNARESGRQEELEAELKGYVESGKLTQEQADLILDYYKEQQSLRNGACPNCGYQFQNGNGMGRGGRMNGGMKGGKGGRMNGGRGMFGQQQTFGQQPAPGQANGMAFGFDMQQIPSASGDEGI